jgi:hypothetical protein
LKVIVCPKASGKELKALQTRVSRMEIHRTLEGRNKTERANFLFFPCVADACKLNEYRLPAVQGACYFINQRPARA